MDNKSKNIRLNRFIAMCGICSRRKADELIKAGKISINKKSVTVVGQRVLQGDVVCLDGRQINPEKKKYLLLNKPKDYITTMCDEKNRKTALDLVKNACQERLVPVGRLDRKTTGLLLFTNDGELAKRLSHPKFMVKKIYQVELNNVLLESELLKIKTGFQLEDGFVKADKINFVNNKKTKLQIQLHSGKNRIIRRVFEHFNHQVIKLDRVEYAFLKKNKLRLGEWRMLTKHELNQLKSI